MQLRVLGPLTIDDHHIGSPQERQLLALLALNRNLVVSQDRLVDLLWGDRAPASATSVLHSKVSRLRRLVGRDALPRQGTGYLLACAPGECDADQLLDALDRQEELDLDEIDRALATWRGRPWPDLEDELDATADAVRLDEARAQLLERRIALLLDDGQSSRAAGEAEHLTGLHPFRERAWAWRIQSLAADGRVVDAVRAFHEFRDLLAEETGLSPSAWLCAMEAELLEGRLGPVAPARAPDAVEEPPPARPVIARLQPSRPAPATSDREPPPLVGREPERAALRSAIAETAAGRGAVVVVAGPLGAGKSRLLRAVAEAATAAGLDATSCDCVDLDQAWLLPIRPVLRALGADKGIASAADLTDEARWARAATATEAVLDATARRPLALLVDDVHRADDGTLAVLEMLAAELGRSRRPLLVVVAHRTPAGSPHDGRLARLSTEPAVEVVNLAPLTEPDLAALVHHSLGRRPTPRFTRQLTAAVDGNPRSALVTLRRLQAEGALADVDGEVGTDEILHVVPSDDLTDEVRGQMQTLDRRAQDWVGIASLLGDSPPVSLVARVLDEPIDVVLDVLGSADRAGLVQLGSGRVRFASGLGREAVSAGVSEPDRYRCNRAVLDRVDGRDEPRQALLGRALLGVAAYDGDLLDDPSLVQVALDAAGVAEAGGAWPQAIDLLEAAAALAPPHDKAELRRRSAVAAFRAHDPSTGRAHFREAAGLAREQGASSTWVRSLLDLHRMELTLGDGSGADGAELVAWLDRQDGDPADEARVLALLAEQRFVTGEPDAGEELVARARDAAERSGDRGIRAEVDFAAGLVHLARLDLVPAERAFRASREQAHLSGDPWVEGWASARVPIVTFLGGDLDRAMEAVVSARTVVEPTRNWSEHSLVEAVAGSVALTRGDLDEARDRAVVGQRLAERSGYRFAAPLLVPLRLHLALLDGSEDPTAAFDWWPQMGAGTRACFRQLIEAHAGRPAAIRLPARPAGIDTAFRVVVAADVAHLSADAELAAETLPALDDLIERGVERLPGYPATLLERQARLLALLTPDAFARPPTPPADLTPPQPSPGG